VHKLTVWHTTNLWTWQEVMLPIIHLQIKSFSSQFYHNIRHIIPIYRALPCVFKRVSAIIKTSFTRKIHAYVWTINASGTYIWHFFCIMLKFEHLRACL
jgi:hypothetical protein